MNLETAGQLFVAEFQGNSIMVYGPNADGDIAPVRSISGANTNLSFPTGLLLDAAGQIYVANYIGQSITVFAANASGDAAPLRRIAGPNTGLNHPGWLSF